MSERMKEKCCTRSALRSIIILGAYLLASFLAFAALIIPVLLWPEADMGILGTVITLLNILFFVPAVQAVLSAMGIFYNLCALKNGESRWKNGLMIVLFVFLILAAIQYGWHSLELCRNA